MRYCRVAAALVSVLSMAFVFAGCLARPMCIAEGSLVQTPVGPVPIEMLKVGSLVVTGDLSGKQSQGTVAAVLESRADRIQRTSLSNGFELRSTPEHPIATPKGFQEAGTLAVGSKVLVSNGVVSVEKIVTEQVSIRVFDLSVEPGNTFYAAGVLVHNKTMMRPPSMADLGGRWVGFDADNDRFTPRLTMDVSADGTIVLEDRLPWCRRSWTGRIVNEPSTQYVSSQKVRLVPRTADDGEGTIELSVSAGAIQKAKLRADEGSHPDRLMLNVVFKSAKELEKFTRE